MIGIFLGLLQHGHLVPLVQLAESAHHHLQHCPLVQPRNAHYRLRLMHLPIIHLFLLRSIFLYGRLGLGGSATGLHGEDIRKPVAFDLDLILRERIDCCLPSDWYIILGCSFVVSTGPAISVVIFFFCPLGALPLPEIELKVGHFRNDLLLHLPCLMRILPAYRLKVVESFD
jgi:hypothetical protein